ncbi:hypothetical protein JG688_00010126 [Phytophthora aleatoria]|uniref:Uncharacterized protein n=1 Tax=Phytophthora aleatoria TaxID=2496075 RepID=A0A8J5M1X1_9STRA|nr:hypothetical protein JG688_00010126 [Phytophthora aleatoria]
MLTAGVYNDPNSVSNFMKEALRYTGPEVPLHEEDLPRQRNKAMNKAIMSTREHGGRYSHDPFHPELFLGDLSKDPRLSTTAPLVEKMVDQHRFRQTRYIAGKLQDDRTASTESISGTKLMLRQIKQGFNDRATRMAGIFDDSFNTMQSRTPLPGDSTHKVGDTIKEDQKIYQVGDEKILPQYSTDIVSKLSNQIGNQWGVQPDQRMGISSVSNICRMWTKLRQQFFALESRIQTSRAR